MTEETDVLAETEEDALKEVKSWGTSVAGWDGIDWDYGYPYIVASGEEIE